MASPNSSTAASPSNQQLRVCRSTYIPGWSIPPRVLLVDDDAVSYKLSSEFLQVFGCTIDIAMDGVTAVNKMNLEKYELVLMVGVRAAFRVIDLVSAGYCHAQAGRYSCHFYNTSIRPHNTHNQHDIQQQANRDHGLFQRYE